MAVVFLYLCAQIQTTMKKGLIFFLISTLFVLSIHTAQAQPRALGGRLGATGAEISYQHSFSSEQFLTLDAGLDLGYSISGRLGGRVCGAYNFIWATPKWTKKGAWKIYAGPGLTTGWVDDRAVIKNGEERANTFAKGFMIAAVGQVGLEYNFPFPLQLSLEIRPSIGIHLIGSSLSFYDNGFLGFVPALGIRYNF